jgi:hypothetical protein
MPHICWVREGTLRERVENMRNKISVEWLKEEDFDEKYYTQVVFVDGAYRILDSWTDEKDIMEIGGQWSRLQQLELRRHYTPSHARWINDDAHKELSNKRC